MSLRDLGYRAYEGTRNPPSHNTWVLMRHGARRAWGSWLVKIATFLCWIPAVVALAGIGIHMMFTQGGAAAEPLNGSDIVRTVVGAELWLLVTLVTLGAGSSAIAEDLTFKAFQFYFAKPVTEVQYLGARVFAVAAFTFGLTFVPLLFVVVALVGTAPDDLRLERAGLVLPALLSCAITAAASSILSVALSAMSKSRALTMSAWIVLFIVPHVLSFIVFKLTEWPWLGLASLPTLLITLYDSLFKIETESALRWFHAAAALAVACAAGLVYAHRRLVRAEVVT